MRLTFLVTSPRVSAGLMSWPAWQAVSSAEHRMASSDASPVARAVAAAGFPVEVREDVTAGALLELAAGSELVWLAGDEESERLAGALATEVVAAADAGRDVPEVEVLHASYDMPGSRLLDLVTVMDRLRRECPWDREQTHRSLVRYLLEECYETIEAVENDDLAHLREELGDLLLQVYFHSRIASEQVDSGDGFTIDDVAGDIVEKLVRRHPHVFAGTEVADADEVEVNWETIKAEEKQRASVLEGIPWAMPALALADKVLGRAAKASVEPAPPVETLGDRLLDLVRRARADGLDAEQELRVAVRRLADRIRATGQ